MYSKSCVNPPWFQPPPRVAETRSSPTDGGRVLYELRGWARHLQQQHFTASEICVDTCADGQECIDHLTGDAPVGPYSVLLLDGQLGDMTGLEVLHALRSTEEGARHPWLASMRIIMLSGNEPDDMEQLSALGVETYWTKPVTVDQLRQVLEGVVEEQLAST